jgi:DNA-binding NarL/FixJ family response regulator
MRKWRVVLLYDQRLLGESLEHLLNALADVEVVAAWEVNATNLPRIQSGQGDVLLMAEEEPSGEKSRLLTAQILDTFPNLPLIRLKLEQGVFQIYTSQTFPASSADLIEAIRSLFSASSSTSGAIPD